MYRYKLLLKKNWYKILISVGIILNLIIWSPMIAIYLSALPLLENL